MKMVYNIREYNTMYTGNKGSEENAIVAIMMTLLNNNKFDNIDDILKYNGKDFNTFMKNNRRDNIPSHYGRNIKDDDFKLIVENFKKMVDNKLSFDKEKINEISFDNKQKEYVEYEGKVVDNSFAERSIEEELKYMQVDNPEYQSLDKKQNTDKMMDEVVNEKKREVEFKNINDIDRNLLNSEEQQLYDATLIDSYLNNEDKQISIEDGLTKDDNNNISKLTEESGNIRIDDNENIKKTSINPLSEIDRDKLTSYEKNIYDAALKYQEVTGELIRLDLDNKIIISPYNEIKEVIMDANGDLVVDDPRVLFSENTMTSEIEKELNELENVKVKKLEFRPFYNNNAA